MAKAIGNGSAVGIDMVFTTLSVSPSVTTTGFSDVTTNLATLYGNLTSLGTASPVTVSFQYATDAYYTGNGNTYNSETTPQAMTATGPYNSPTHTLLPGTTYHFRAKALGDGTSYGSDMTFTTTTTPPSVITQPATNIAFNSATLNGNLTSLGTAASGNVSFQWTTDAYYTGYGNTYDSETSPAQTMTDPGNFTFNLSTLSSGTTYHFRAKAVGQGTSYGNDTTFTTNSTPPSVATNAATNVTNNSATLNGNLTSMGTATSINVSFQWATDAYYTSQGNTYANETTAQAMGATGSFSTPLSSLSGATTYHFRAKAVGQGTAYGNDTTFTTTQIMHTLTMAVSGSGSTTPAAGSYSYAEGTVVNISATPAIGWHFSTWSANVANPSSASTTVTMDADKTVTATFAQDQYTLTINIVGQGNVTRVPNQPTYTYGTSVQLTAAPQGGWSFSSWSGDLLGSTNPDNIVMNGNRTVTATFTQIMHTLTMAVSGSGSTTPAAGSYSYAEGTVVNISATPAIGWHFSTWSANVANPSSASTTVTMDADKTVTATFAQDQYTLTINIVGQGNVTRVPNQPTYTYGTSVQLTAAPQGGWSFSSWSGDLLGSTNPDNIVMNGNRTVNANFSNAPAVATDSAQNVTSGSATLRGILNDKGTATTVSVSFEWANDNYYTNNGSSYNNETTPPWPMLSTGAFSFALGGLSPEATYHFRAKATGQGTAYGVDMTFTTGPLQPPNQPPNINPIQGALCVSLPVTVQSAPFSDPDPGDTHAASQWQIRTSAGDYASPVYDSGRDTIHLTSITLTENELNYSTTYYWRVRHQDNHGAWSNWSIETMFMTADTPIGSDVALNRSGTNINFYQVNTGGCTWVTTTSVNPVGTAPSGIAAAGVFVDVSTTATYAGRVSVGVPYDPSATQNMKNLRLFHWNGSSWVDVTTSVDTTNNIVYGEVNSLSWFFIGGQWVWIQDESVPAYPNMYIGIAAAFGAGFLAFFLRRRLLHKE